MRNSSSPNAAGPSKPTSATSQLHDDTSCAPVEEKHFVPLSDEFNTADIRYNYSSTVIQMQHGVTSLYIHSKTMDVNESTETLHGCNNLYLS